MSYNYETQFNSKNFTDAASALRIFGMARVIEGITLHWWGLPSNNPAYESIRGYLLDNSSNTSAHWVATGTGRRVACIVDPINIAHHAGSAWGNARTVGIELDPRNRPEDRDVVAELIADIRSAFGDVPLYWHSYFTNTQCPGVYKDIIDQIDQLSYTKYSHATEWGKGGDIKPKTPVIVPAPAPAPLPPVVEPAKPKSLWKLSVDGKQKAAYSTEINAYRGYVEYGKTGVIKLDNKDVTAEIVARYTAPSPTTQEGGVKLPDSGKPIVDKDDYEETKKKVNFIWEFLTNLFKGFGSK